MKTKIIDNKEKSIVERLMDEMVPDVNNDFEFECEFLIKSINRRLEDQYMVSIDYHMKSNLWYIPRVISDYGDELCRLPKDLFDKVIMGFIKKGYSVIRNNHDNDNTVTNVIIYKAVDKTYCERCKVKL